MTTENKSVSIDGWVMKFQRPYGDGPFPVVLMLHGWTGDENSMWVFAPRLVNHALLIAPRGLFESRTTGGYSWYADRSKPWPWVADFEPAVNKILEVISSATFPEGDFSQLHLIGFSQGAALAYTTAIMHPEKIASLVGLSGFMPDGASRWLENERLIGMPAFIAHGTEDSLVPVERARLSVRDLEAAGARVTYCEDTVEHKLSAKCFRGLEAFYRKFSK